MTAGDFNAVSAIIGKRGNSAGKDHPACNSDTINSNSLINLNDLLVSQAISDYTNTEVENYGT